jgi:hypothetical protein
MPVSDSTYADWQIPGSARVASSIARSVERRGLEEKAVVEALEAQVEHWQKRGEWTKLKCIELLFLCGWANKDVAAELGLSEQQVANYKFDFVARLQTIIRRQGLSPEVFPELVRNLAPTHAWPRSTTMTTICPASASLNGHCPADPTHGCWWWTVVRGVGNTAMCATCWNSSIRPIAWC